jgi:hypothetical protein
MTASAAKLPLTSRNLQPPFMLQTAAARVLCVVTTFLALISGAAAWGESAPFDLSGPNLEAQVTRGKTTLPISAVPNLQAGDGLWIRADLPATQSERYLMVVAFLRGATNPPPEDWFYSCKTWTGECARRGLYIAVPQEAQQVLVFLAPQTGGDYRTLVNTVRGRPGAFVRASQDLNQATLDRSRLEQYLSAVRAMGEGDPAKLKEAAPLLARSLLIKVDTKCLDKIPELQASCLMQQQDSLILDDGHSRSIVEALTSGPASDLAMELSFTPQLSYGYYSPYIASVLDIARILDSFHTARYQYIPALAAQHGDRLALALNTPPSFRDPKSVLVAALPAVEQAQLPPLHSVDPKESYCAEKTALVLPVEGAPLVFSTGYAHHVRLSLTGKDGHLLELPVSADAGQGGFVVDTSRLGGSRLGENVHGVLHGDWGFETYEGPAFELVNGGTHTWEIAPEEAASLVVGRENTIHLKAGNVTCIDHINLQDAAGKELKAEWRKSKPNEVTVSLPLQAASPGAMTLLVTLYGSSQPQPIPLQAFSEPGHIESFTLHAGDSQGILKGNRLDQVATLVTKDIGFLPGALSSIQGQDQLILQTLNPAAGAFKQGDILKAKVTLKDGRVLDVKVTVSAPRPAVVLIGKSVQPSTRSDSRVRLTSADELPQDSKLNFSVRAKAPSRITRDESIEIETTDEAFSTVLTLKNGGLTLQNTSVAVATLDPAEAFGPSAFGPLQFRVVADGVSGNWQPLATLVRLPALKNLACPTSIETACELSGSNLFLVDSVSSDAQFKQSVQVPDGFPGQTLTVPHPTGNRLYLKLRDDPAATSEAALEPRQLPGADRTPDSQTAQAAGQNDRATADAAQSSVPPTPATAEQPYPLPVLAPQTSPLQVPALSGSSSSHVTQTPPTPLRPQTQPPCGQSGPTSPDSPASQALSCAALPRDSGSRNPS